MLEGARETLKSENFGTNKELSSEAIRAGFAKEEKEHPKKKKILRIEHALIRLFYRISFLETRDNFPRRHERERILEG